MVGRKPIGVWCPGEKYYDALRNVLTEGGFHARKAAPAGEPSWTFMVDGRAVSQEAFEAAHREGGHKLVAWGEPWKSP